MSRLAVLTAALAALSACAVSVQSGLDEREANEVVVVLRSEGVLAEKTGGSSSEWGVEVPRTQEQRALSVMVEYRLPRRETRYEELLEESSGLVPSASSERLHRAALIEEALEGTLLALAGVHDAAVHVVLPSEQTALSIRTETARPRVSVVLVQAEPGPSDEAVRSIAMGAVDGLEPGDIAIVRTPARLPEAPPPELVSVGPFAVAAESATAVRTTLQLLAGFVLLLSCALGFVTVRRTEP